MGKLRRLLLLAALLGAGALHAAPAVASSTQEAVFQDDTQLRAHPGRTLDTLRSLGVTRVRVTLVWDTVAPAAGSRHKPKFNAADPGAPYDFSAYDAIVQAAAADGISVYFTVTGPAPLWATGPGMPRGGPYGQWKPSPREFGAFVRAAGQRYSGGYTPSGAGAPLPRVSFWSIWNEPNYGYDLAPQATNNDTIEVGAAAYRSLLDAAWAGLEATGHTTRSDTILIGETAPRGLDHPIGNFSGVKPLRFLRALYCVDSRLRELRGRAAQLRACPTTSAGSRHFRTDHPALFEASGFADHPYALQANPGPPNVPTNEPGKRGSDPDYADFPQLPKLEGLLDRLNRTYGSHTRFPVWNTEFGYRTHPPDPHVRTSQATAAYYMNWAEYLSFRQSRLRSYMQYLLVDPSTGVFASGLELPNEKAKATYDAYRMPLYLPVTSTRRGRRLEVWGAARPAVLDLRGAGRVSIQLQRGGRGAWKTVATVALHNRRGYFDARVNFGAPGNVRTAWSAPGGSTVYSRTVAIKVT